MPGMFKGEQGGSMTEVKQESRRVAATDVRETMG